MCRRHLAVDLLLQPQTQDSFPPVPAHRCVCVCAAQGICFGAQLLSILYGGSLVPVPDVIRGASGERAAFSQLRRTDLQGAPRRSRLLGDLRGRAAPAQLRPRGAGEGSELTASRATAAQAAPANHRSRTTPTQFRGTQADFLSGTGLSIGRIWYNFGGQITPKPANCVGLRSFDQIWFESGRLGAT